MWIERFNETSVLCQECFPRAHVAYMTPNGLVSSSWCFLWSFHLRNFIRQQLSEPRLGMWDHWAFVPPGTRLCEPWAFACAQASGEKEEEGKTPKNWNFKRSLLCDLGYYSQWQSDSKVASNDPHFLDLMRLCNPLLECGMDLVTCFWWAVMQWKVIGLGHKSRWPLSC